MRGLLLIVLLAVSVSAQEIQIKKVYDFSGGLVNSISNAAMRDNMAAVLLNYDITPFGNLTRRQGMVSYGGQLRRVFGIFPYITSDKRELLLLTQNSTWDNTCKITRCDFATGQCTTTVEDNFYYPSTDWKVPFGVDHFMFDDKLYFAVSNSEMMTYDGTNLYPVRPRGAGQARVLPINGIGNLKGIYRYKFCFIDTTANDNSNFSPPTWYVNVNYGKVAISDIWQPDDTTVQDQIAIYRETDLSGNYEHLITVANTTTDYTDTFTITSAADTFDYRWGENRHCCGANAAADAPQDPTPEIWFLRAPGAMSVNLTGGVDDTLGHGKPNDQVDNSYKRFYMAWSVVFVDTNGRHSYMSTPICVGELHRFAPAADSMDDLELHAALTDIPVPHDSGIVRKLLLRMHANDQFSTHQHTDSGWLNRYVVIDTLEPDSTTYTDSIQYNATWSLPTYDASSGGCVGRDPADTIDYILGDSSWAHFLRYDSIGEIQELACYDDSVTEFTPSALIYSGNRAYTIGNSQMANALYYSDFGRFSIWPPGHFLGFPTLQGDWPIGLAKSQNGIILFRQSSIWQLTGQTFYQFSTDRLVDNIGLSAPRSVARVGNDIYFYHSSGAYRLSPFGAVDVTPISLVIQESLDSFMVNQQRAVGASMDNEYWLCFDYQTSLQTTYIYSETPIPHWRAYDFGFQSITRFDVDTLSGTFNPNRWLIARIQNLGSGIYLWKWQKDNLSDYVNVDTMDVSISNVPDTTYYEINATYQSKRFFEGRERERIYWLDIVGEGIADTITFTFLDEGVDFKTVDFVPNFTDDKRDRIIVDHIVHDFAVRWQDNGHGQYQINSYVIGYVNWDKGRPAP